MSEKEKAQILEKDELKDFILTMKKLNAGLKVTLPSEFTRVKVNKLVVPRSFKKHVELMCDMLDVNPATFYQGLMMDAMGKYIDKLSKVSSDENLIEDINKKIKELEDFKGESKAAKKFESDINKLNMMVLEGKYDESLSPEENLALYEKEVEEKENERK